PHALSSLTALFPSSCPCRLASPRSEGWNCASLPSEANPSEDISNDPFLRLVHYQRTLSSADCSTNELLLDATSYHHQVVKDRLDPGGGLTQRDSPAAVFQPGRHDQFSPRSNVLISVSWFFASTYVANLLAGVPGVNPVPVFFAGFRVTHHVAMTGCEPVTSWLQTTRSPSCATPPARPAGCRTPGSQMWVYVD